MQMGDFNLLGVDLVLTLYWTRSLNDWTDRDEKARAIILSIISVHSSLSYLRFGQSSTWTKNSIKYCYYSWYFSKDLCDFLDFFQDFWDFFQDFSKIFGIFETNNFFTCSYTSVLLLFQDQPRKITRHFKKFFFKAELHWL